MAKGSKSEKNQKFTRELAETNFWDVCIRFLDVVNDLFKTGNIFGAVLLLAFLFSAYISFKLPPENVNNYILLISKFVVAEKFYIFPCIVLLAVSLMANYLQHLYYTKEIKRLVLIRKQLIHGQNNGEINLLSDHSSSEFNIEATE